MIRRVNQTSFFLAKILVFLALGLFIYGWLVNAYVKIVSKPYIFLSEKKATYTPSVIILGASVYRSGQLSAVLKQRMELGIWYALTHKTPTILLSGHAIPGGYNEPKAMAKYAQARMVPPQQLRLDEHGSSTYASLFNCKYKFGYDSILIISQKYHLFRAIYIARSMNLKAIGLVAPEVFSSKPQKMKWREILSRIKDFTLLKVYRFFHRPK